MKFEQLYHNLTKNDMKLPEGVRAIFVLNAANISEENEILARATVGDLTYDNMKSTIMKIFGDPSVTDDLQRIPAVKNEASFGYSTSNNRDQRGRSNYHRNHRGGLRNQKEMPPNYPSSEGPKGYFSHDRNSQDSKGCQTHTNPKGKDGNVMRCHQCDSTKHFASLCPHRFEKSSSSSTNETHITLLNSEPEASESCLIGKTLGMAVLNSGCTKTVTGEVWLTEYLATLTWDEHTTVERKPSSALFRSGDGKEVKSIALVKIPIVLAGQPFMLDTSRTSMKRANIILDFHTDTIKVGPNEVKLSCTTTGHSCIPLSRTNLQTEVKQSSIVPHTTNLKHLNKKEAMKLHCQFSHASKEKLLKLVTDSAHYGDKEFMECIKECSDNCAICRKYKQPPLHPVVGFCKQMISTKLCVLTLRSLIIINPGYSNS